MGSLRILIADDHEVVRRGLRSLLASRADWEICGEAVDGRDAVQKAKGLKPDLVMLDISMPLLNGLDAARMIRRESPRSEILILSQHESNEVVRAATDAGARGYVAKADISRDLLSAIEAVSQHKTAFSSNFEDIQAREGPPAEEEAVDEIPVLEQQQAVVTSQSTDFLVGGGEMAERMRSLDWSQTDLGPMEQWPQSLKTSVSICLASCFPIVMYWGPECVVLYNDAYSTILGSKHPWALGQRCRDCWAEIWDTIGPMLDSVVDTAQATWSDDLFLLLHRHGYPEECYFSFSFSPIRIETGAVGGVFTAVMETTDKVIGERRLRTLRDLAAGAVDAKSEPAAWRIAAETLAENLHDIPFSILCQVSGPDSRVRVLGTAGIDGTHSLVASLCTPDSSLAESLRRITDSRKTVELKDLGGLTGELPRGAWNVPPESALLLPIADLGQDRVSGVLIAAVSPRKALDDTYRTFFQLVAGQVATSVADARAHEDERKREKHLRDQAELERRRFQELLQQAPAAIGSMSGPEHRWTFVNRAMLEVTGRQRVEDFIGRTVRESLPEIEGQGYLELLDQVYRTGEPFVGTEMKVMLKRGAKQRDDAYFNFVYQPISNVGGEVEGILVHAVEVTQHVLARQAIEKSEERLRLAQAAAQVGTWEWDPADNSSSLSPELHQMFGIEPADGQHFDKWASRVFPEDMSEVRAVMEAARHSGTMDFEYRYQHPERGLRWFYCKGHRFSSDESDARMFGVVLDVTERKQVEEALQKAHEELDIRVQERTAELARATEELKGQAQLLDLAHDAIIVRDLANEITFWNEGAEKTYGWSAEEALGKTTHTLLATEFPEPLADVERKLFDSASWEGELVHRRKDGSQIVVESRQVLQGDEQDRPIRILEINRDVTLRRRAEERVAEQAKLLDLANDAIFVRTLDSKLTYWNRGAERLYGWKKHEVLGKPVADILHTEFPVPFGEITAHLASYGAWEGELKHSRRDGTRITVSSRWTMWTDNSGKPLGFLEINTDVTDRKLAEQNLRALSARLLQLQDEERRRIARELHDSAGQLLVALSLNLASIQSESGKLGAGPARTIAESKELVQELSKELRTISHLLHPPLLDETGLPSAVRWYVDGFAQRSKIPVKLELAPDLGRLPRELETTIFRIIQECLTNVHRHSQSPVAEIRICRLADRVTVEVRDEGKGMSAGTHRGSTKPVVPGVGIQGMRERVRQLGGQLEIESAQDRGTVICATLPAEQAFSDNSEETFGAAPLETQKGFPSV